MVMGWDFSENRVLSRLGGWHFTSPTDPKPELSKNHKAIRPAKKPIRKTPFLINALPLPWRD
jgi:hypothetical protein